MHSQIFDEGESQALFHNAYTRDNHTFTGWNTNQNGNGTTYTDGQTITISSDMILYAQWTANSSQGGGNATSSGQLNGHAYVDLGLPSGLLWATCNVGANTPVEYGDYFAWGETTPKEDYWWITYQHCNGSDNTLTKYCSDVEMGYNGFLDELTTLEASDDAATANWGAGWRMPTYDEMNELINRCTKTCVTYNDVNGYLFTGPNGNSIFLPDAGLAAGDIIFAGEGGGCYWSSSLVTSITWEAWSLHFIVDNNCYNTSTDERFYGYPVRPVCTSSQK
jgi:Listeria/Bacterioides repeat